MKLIIEHQFSINQPRLLNDDVADRLDSLIEKAYKIIDESGDV